MKVSKTEQHERRAKVKEEMLKGNSPKDIAKHLGCSYPTVLGDIEFIQAYHTKLALNNPYIAQKQLEKINRLEDEMELIKKEFWKILAELDNDSKLKYTKELSQLNKAKNYMREKEWAKATIEIEKVERKLEIEKYPRYRTKIDTLKALMDRIDKQLKIYNIFNPSTLIINQYISFGDFKKILESFKDILMEYVPEEKRLLAIERMKQVRVVPLDSKEIIDIKINKE